MGGGDRPRPTSPTSPGQSGATLKRMEVVGDASGSEPGEIRALKPCLLRRNHSREQHGVAASCLEELRSKGWRGTRGGNSGGGGRGRVEPGRARVSGGDRAGSGEAPWGFL